MRVSACIFDFDGVIIDSEKYHHLAWEQLAHELGVTFTYDEYKPFKSAGRKVVIPYLLKKANIPMTEQLYHKFDLLRTQRVEKTLSLLNKDDIIPGVLDFLQLLHKNDIKCAVASSSATSHVIAQRFGVFSAFDAFVDGSDNLPNKPAPQLFLRAAQLLNVPPHQCAVFEDSINGLLAAQSAEMYSVGLQTYFTDIADKIIDNFVGANISLLEFKEKYA